MNTQLEKLSLLVKKSNNIVFFGGAGVSTESNIPDFRSESGLYSTKFGNFPAETMLSRTFFDKHTDDFYKFYKEKMIYKDAQPNMTHIALAQLEKMEKIKAVITQNIDGLHQKAGSKKVLELHGSILRNYCTNCNTFYNLDFIINSINVPICKKCNSIIKPDVTLYEESLNMSVFNEALTYISNAEILIIGGTSLIVYPAASLIRYYSGDELILVNKTSTSYDNIANIVINDSLGKVFEYIISSF